MGFSRSSIGSLLGAVACCLLALLALTAAVTLAVWPVPVVDSAGTATAHGLTEAWPSWPEVLWIVTVPGAGSVTSTALVVVAVGFCVRRQWRPAVLLMATGMTAGSICLWIKHLVTRARPEFLGPQFGVDGWSFPSSHTTNATAAACAIVVVFWPRLRPRARAVLVTVAALFSVGIGATRIGLSVHWATDVAAGLTLGVGWVLLLTVLLVATERRRSASAEAAPAVNGHRSSDPPSTGFALREHTEREHTARDRAVPSRR